MTPTHDNTSSQKEEHLFLPDAADVYFSHPYASWERGTSENRPKLIILKGNLILM